MLHNINTTIKNARNFPPCLRLPFVFMIIANRPLPLPPLLLPYKKVSGVITSGKHGLSLFLCLFCFLSQHVKFTFVVSKIQGFREKG